MTAFLDPLSVQGAPMAAPVGPGLSSVETTRPTRAELRRAAEAQAAGGAAPAGLRPTVALATSRSESRRRAAAEMKATRSRHAIWKAWWLYPLLVGIAVTVYLGVQSASLAPSREPVVITTIAPVP